MIYQIRSLLDAANADAAVPKVSADAAVIGLRASISSQR